jgi:hypothetical protein
MMAGALRPVQHQRTIRRSGSRQTDWRNGQSRTAWRRDARTTTAGGRHHEEVLRSGRGCLTRSWRVSGDRREAGIDLLWFGIDLVIVVEMAQITPPVGFNLFVLQGMTGHDIGYIARAALPMFFIMCLAVALVVAFPQIVTFLPSRL